MTYPTPLSMGVNFFAQNPRYDDRGGEENGYCFPPIFLIGPAIQHLLSSKAKATVIIPDLIPRPYWWPMLRRCANKRYLLAKKGNHEVLLWPSKCHGFHQPRQLSLPWDLWVFRRRSILNNYYLFPLSFLFLVFSPAMYDLETCHSNGVFSLLRVERPTFSVLSTMWHTT